MGKPARPAPPPQTEIATRLEHVRTHFGFPSLRSFWTHLAEGWDEEDRVSYEAVRNYHYDRDPPVAYLARVSELFGVRLPYLVSGEEPMTEEEVQGLWQSVSHQEGYESWSRGIEVRNGFLRGLGGWGLMTHRYMPAWVAPVGHVCQFLGTGPEDVGRAFRAMLDSLGIAPPRGRERDHFILSMIPALLTLGPASERQRATETTTTQEDGNGEA